MEVDNDPLESIFLYLVHFHDVAGRETQTAVATCFHLVGLSLQSPASVSSSSAEGGLRRAHAKDEAFKQVLALQKL